MDKLKHYPKSLVIHGDWWNFIQFMSMEERGYLFTCILKLINQNPIEESQLPERCFFAWKMISGLLDISIQKYQEKCERNSVAAHKRWQGNLRSPKNGMQMDSNTDNKNNTDTKIDNKTKNDNKNNTETKKTVSFQRPTLDEVKAYCQSINSPIDAEQFYNFYEAKDWMLGKNHIKKWKCCVRTWERNQTKTNKTYISDSQKEAWMKGEI